MQSPNICARRWCPSTRWKKSPSRSFWRHLTASTMFQGGHIFHPQPSRALTSVRSELQRTPLSVEEFSLTTGLWSSATMAPYMSLTVHFIDQDWKLVSKCLQTSFLPEDHTAVNLADALQDALREWELSADKVSCLTTDSGANIKAAVQNLGWPWLSCFRHNLNLAVSNTLEKTEKLRTDRALAVCRTINGMFSHSWRRRRELQKAQVELGLPHHSLVTVS